MSMFNKDIFIERNRAVDALDETIQERDALLERNAKLVAAIQRIDAINDRPACCFNQEISDVCDSILMPTSR